MYKNIKNIGLLSLILMSAIGFAGDQKIGTVSNLLPGAAKRLVLAGAGVSAVGGLLHILGNIQFQSLVDIENGLSVQNVLGSFLSGMIKVSGAMGKAVGLGGIAALSAGALAVAYNYKHGISDTSNDPIKQYQAKCNDKVLVQRVFAGLRTFGAIASYKMIEDLATRAEFNSFGEFVLKALAIAGFCSYDIYKNLDCIKSVFEEYRGEAATAAA